MDKLETQIKGSDDVNVRKVVDKMKKARKSLDQSLGKCVAKMARVRSAEKSMPALEKMLKALEATNPKYADIFDKVFPKAVNLALSGASAGVGFKDAKTALDTANAALGLVNDVAMKAAAHSKKCSADRRAGHRPRMRWPIFVRPKALKLLSLGAN